MRRRRGSACRGGVGLWRRARARLQQVVAGLGAGGRVDDPGGAVGGFTLVGMASTAATMTRACSMRIRPSARACPVGAWRSSSNARAEPGEACGVGWGVACVRLRRRPTTGGVCRAPVVSPSRRWSARLLRGTPGSAARGRARGSARPARARRPRRRAGQREPAHLGQRGVDPREHRGHQRRRRRFSARARHSTTCPPSCPPQARSRGVPRLVEHSQHCPSRTLGGARRQLRSWVNVVRCVQPDTGLKEGPELARSNTPDATASHRQRPPVVPRSTWTESGQ